MPQPTDLPAEVDERTTRLIRGWYAELRQRDRDKAAAEKAKQRRSRQDDVSVDGRLWSWLTGDNDADSGDD